ncbi:hypothetical protein GCM10008107_07440 [Psychrosphaera saromensis]|uniref:FAD-binding oxidoreductase n=1 Tax=Psychrosphaera saromensis TaxID=716813 RepID=A0A2S7UXY7_9GAMM|nr:hypothetical protein [Psychrosphaera saromensis]PQJ54352.1 hypothetical protein BTO11_12250 [Psychrosphaera saromensis]GHB60707.1 hypothetical protein GCM10008107_07440 [Psychrosphaera saromensis]GLQ14558.1 hypothetical protein GCM10007917_20130 [Psychrosphaera saromensis]
MRTALTLIFVLITLFASNSVLAEKLKPFTSDGCSIFPDGTLEHKDLWLACCTAHDYAYWQGGTAEQKEIADKELKNCVAKVGQPKIAELMLAGVIVGGNPYLPTPFRWGYGWPYPRDYKMLTEEELLQVKAADPFKDSNKNNN